MHGIDVGGMITTCVFWIFVNRQIRFCSLLFLLKGTIQRISQQEVPPHGALLTLTLELDRKKMTKLTTHSMLVT